MGGVTGVNAPASVFEGNPAPGGQNAMKVANAAGRQTIQESAAQVGYNTCFGKFPTNAQFVADLNKAAATRDTVGSKFSTTA